jgi:tRNA(Arg) A34 adenosine deaminase TadA
MNTLPIIQIDYPDWLKKSAWLDQCINSDEEKMHLALSLAKANVENNTGGPFGAAIFEMNSGKLISVGVNLVTWSNLSVLHAEIVAFLMAQKRVGSYSLGDTGEYELFSSSEPCAMCLGATLWSGVKRIVFGASGKAARAIGFDEGPVFDKSWQYLKNAGIIVEEGLLAKEAEEILKLYKDKGGVIYNG